MRKVNRILAMLLIMALSIAGIFFVPVFAKDEFDINNYTISDLSNLSSDERLDLLNNFIDTYNPIGMKDIYNQVKIQPRWTSDSDLIADGQQVATHQLVTLQAFYCFINDFGFYNINGTEALVVALVLAGASGLPDKDEQGIPICLGHFYNPDTQKNYLGQTNNTAKTNAQGHFTNAYNRLLTDIYMPVTGEDFTYVLNELGRALHYVQDASEPHHANNKSVGSSTHSQFETFTETNVQSYIEDLNHCAVYYYNVGHFNNAGGITHEAAVLAKPYYSMVSSFTDHSQWNDAAYLTTRNALGFSCGMIFRLFYISGLPFASV